MLADQYHLQKHEFSYVFCIFFLQFDQQSITIIVFVLKEKIKYNYSNLMKMTVTKEGDMHNFKLD